MDLEKFNALPARERALIAIAVLLDGREASTYLGSDSTRGEELMEIAGDLASTMPEMRMPLVGTLLRSALKELRGTVPGG